MNDFVLVLVVITALGFDFTNGFHDTGNAMATSIATKALEPRVAVALSGVLNLVGAFLSLTVAATIASGLVDTNLVTLTVVAAGLAGGIIWNLLTWLLGIPSSSSHALIGGVIGSTLAAAGGHAIQWRDLVAKVIIPAGLSPIIAALVAATGTYLLYRISRRLQRGRAGPRLPDRPDRVGLHGVPGARHQRRPEDHGRHHAGPDREQDAAHRGRRPFWVILSCGLAISLGTYMGGWRVIRTLGKGLVEIEAPQGMAAESASAAVILLSSHFGYSLSTTHVATGSIIGTGLGKKGAEVRWNVAGRMATAWVFTLPSAAVVGAGAYALANAIGNTAGVVVDLILLIAVAGVIYWRSRKTRVGHDNVNSEWTGGVDPNAPAQPEPAAAA